MPMKAFDAYDYEVVKAHGIASGSSDEGLAPLWAIRRHHPGPLPAQRLSGMQRRGLMHLDKQTWKWHITAEGVRQADAYRDSQSEEVDR